MICSHQHSLTNIISNININNINSSNSSSSSSSSSNSNSSSNSIRNKYWNSAAKFLREADIPLSRMNGPPSGEANSLNSSLKHGLMDIASKGDIVGEDGLLPSKMLMDANDTFLLEWWEIFQSLFNGDVESGYTQDHNISRERIVPILPAHTKSNIPPHFSNIPSSVVPPTQNSFPVAEENFRPNGNGNNVNLNDPANRNMSERFVSRTTGGYDKLHNSNFVADTTINSDTCLLYTSRCV